MKFNRMSTSTFTRLPPARMASLNLKESQLASPLKLVMGTRAHGSLLVKVTKTGSGAMERKLTIVPSGMAGTWKNGPSIASNGTSITLSNMQLPQLLSAEALLTPRNLAHLNQPNLWLDTPHPQPNLGSTLLASSSPKAWNSRSRPQLSKVLVPLHPSRIPPQLRTPGEKKMRSPRKLKSSRHVLLQLVTKRSAKWKPTKRSSIFLTPCTLASQEVMK